MKRLKNKMLNATATEEDLLVDLTFHELPASLLEQFFTQVVKPYYSGNLAEAVKDLLRKAVAEEEFVQRHTLPG